MFKNIKTKSDLDARKVKKVKENLQKVAKETRSAAMLEGFKHKGYQCSVTSTDGNAMLQIAALFTGGSTETTVHFKNGTKMPLKDKDAVTFIELFKRERNKFFTDTA